MQVRIVCISDTHNKTGRLVVPHGDVLLHAGDFTMKGKLNELDDFAEFIGESRGHKIEKFCRLFKIKTFKVCEIKVDWFSNNLIQINRREDLVKSIAEEKYVSC